MSFTSSSAGPVSITVLDRLSDSQILQAEALAAACRQADSISLSYPSDEECRHYLLSGPDGRLLAALAVIPYENCQAECCAFTLPQHRRQGYFSALLERALKEWEEYEFTFTVEESCRDTCAVLEALGASLDHRDLQMEYRAPGGLTAPDGGSLGMTAPQSGDSPDLTAPDGSGFPAPLLLRPVSDEPDCPDETGDTPDDFSRLWQLTTSSRLGLILGSCRTFPLSPETVCLHHVEISSPFRQKGLGTALIRLLLETLAAEGVTHVLLHVAGDNSPAVALYKKTGFCVTKTLSCFLY